MFPAGRPELRTRYLELASGLHVRAVESGSHGAPRIVMFPGWACSAYVFRENLAPLAAAGFHVLAIELKGHGLSDKPRSPEEYRLEPMRRHVIDILDALAGDPPMLAGLSIGAALAAHVAESDPHRVRAVAMVSPVGFSGVPGLSVFKALTPSPVTPFLPRLATRPVIDLILRTVNGRLRQITPRDVDEYWAPTQFPEFPRAMRHLLHEFSWRAPFPRLKVPCMLISGSRDRFLSRSVVRSFCETLPSMRHIEVPDAGHVVYDEAAPVVNIAMTEFFRGAVR